MDINQVRPAVIGLGYVGLPLAVEIEKSFDVVGFDISTDRISDLRANLDITNEVTAKELETRQRLQITDQEADLKECNFFIVTVPTPIDEYKRPDLRPLLAASELVGRYLSKGDIVVYESTVYPGVTEEICVPVLEKSANLAFNQDFFAGYSPERINPGDKTHRISDIVKVTSGSTIASATLIDQFYKTIITAGTYLAESIRVAEAAKVIENTQRDINIALVNELATLFDKMNIDTHSVLEAASTKWNFLPFTPGLVGGHCIGVDPYYLTHKAQQLGHHPELILSGRRINDSMPKFVADKLVLELVKSKIDLKNTRVAVMGVTFKENCPDVRNSKVCDLVRMLTDYGVSVDIIDPRANKLELMKDYGLSVSDSLSGKYHGIIIAVKHAEFLNSSAADLRKNLEHRGLIFDLKNCLPSDEVDLRL